MLRDKYSVPGTAVQLLKLGHMIQRNIVPIRENMSDIRFAHNFSYSKSDKHILLNFFIVKKGTNPKQELFKMNQVF